MAKKKAGDIPPKFTEAEADLVWHMEHGWHLETDSLGAEPVLRRLTDDEVMRPASANRNTVKSLEEKFWDASQMAVQAGALDGENGRKTSRFFVGAAFNWWRPQRFSPMITTVSFTT